MQNQHWIDCFISGEHTQKTALLAKPGHVVAYGTITYTRARQLAWIRTDGHVVNPATSKGAVDRCAPSLAWTLSAGRERL